MPSAYFHVTLLRAVASSSISMDALSSRSRLVRTPHPRTGVRFWRLSCHVCTNTKTYVSRWNVNRMSTYKRLYKHGHCGDHTYVQQWLLSNTRHRHLLPALDYTSVSLFSLSPYSLCLSISLPRLDYYSKVNVARFGVRRIDSVSYTHLTLPTNREV